ncbi:hypothetical protein A2U01_0112608, partial [Trifolium medium]|nr:hypothetical protein [Trifolium medium]
MNTTPWELKWELDKGLLAEVEEDSVGRIGTRIG